MENKSNKTIMMILGLVLIIIIAIILVKTPKRDMMQNTDTPKDTQVQEINIQDNSDEVDSIEKDLMNTNIDNLDK